MDSNTAHAFIREFEEFMNCLEETIKTVPADEWTSGESPRRTPVHQACHALVGILKYTEAELDAGITFRFKEPDKYPNRQRVLDAAAIARKALPGYINGVVARNATDREFSVPPLFKMIYLLRHSVIHLSYLRNELSQRGIRLPEYSKRYRPRSQG